MPEAWRVEQLKRAEAALSHLLEANPGFAVNGDPPEWLVGTHCVTFGTLHGQPVVFKYFDWLPRKKREEESLRLFASTGLVPKLYPVESDSVLLMERLRGTPLNEIEQTLAQADLQRVYHQLGQALARILEAAPGNAFDDRRHWQAKMGHDYEFYCYADLPTLFDTVTTRSAKVLAEQDVPHKPILQASLSALQRNRNAILAHPVFVQMDDFHANNIIADGATLTGFIDLEMTRHGNEVLLLAAVIAMKDRWDWIRQGYEERQGKPISRELLSLARTAAPFSQWTRFMWYWTGNPQDFEEGARNGPIREIKATVEALGDI